MPLEAPTLADCGSRLRVRTFSDETGGEIGTFNEHTRPVGTEVTGFIADAMIEVRALLPDDEDVLSAKILAYAQLLVEVRACMSIEVRLGVDTSAEDSAYARLNEIWVNGVGTDRANPGQLRSMLADAGQSRPDRARLVSAQLVTPFSGDADLLEDDTLDELMG
ncbi:MAG: hypothetical protein PGN13_16110 [Patulibacter minatonensis]